MPASMLRSTVPAPTGACFQRPNPSLKHITLDHFGPFLASRKSPESRAENPVTRASSGNRNRHSEPCQGCPAGLKTTPAPNDPKLGRLPLARQGLVRVPESNTKYGGKLGKTGVVSRPRWRQLSVSPQGFPRKKIIPSGAQTGFRPLFTGQLFIARQGLPCRDSPEVTVGRG